MSDNSPSVPLPLSRSSGELTERPQLWMKVAAFKDLLERGGPLLAEVSDYVRSTHDACQQTLQEKQVLDEERAAFEQQKSVFEQERASFEELRQKQESGLSLSRRDLEQQQAQLRFKEQEVEAQHIERRQSITTLSTEISKVGEVAERSMDVEMALLQQLKAKLAEAKQGRTDEAAMLELQTRIRILELERDQLQTTLQAERERRNRMLNMVRPQGVTDKQSIPS